MAKKKNSKVKIKTTTKKVVYDVYCIYNGFDPEFDKELNAITGKHSHSSGFFLLDGNRDLTWEFSSKKEADKICSKLKENKRVITASVSTYKES